MTTPRNKDTDENASVMVWDLPFIDTPFTRMSEHWCTAQGGPCADFEMDYARCASRVGLKNVHKSCSEYLADWKECISKAKAHQRHTAMQAERKKQGLPFAKPPPPDSIFSIY